MLLPTVLGGGSGAAWLPPALPALAAPCTQGHALTQRLPSSLLPRSQERELGRVLGPIPLPTSALAMGTHEQDADA